MRFRFKNITIKKTSLYYYVLILAAIIILLANYPRLYGVDAFQVMWMAKALQDGALFSDNTWLISPFSYFGYYPFSHRAIGVPMILAFLMSLLDFLSFGTFGLTEAVLVFNIILIIVIYKTSRNLGDRLFEEEWSRVVFVAAILFSVNAIHDFAMTVSTRIIITITMIVLLNISLKLLEKDAKIRFKTIIVVILVFLIGALAHRLWMNSTMTIVFLIFTLLIRKYKKSYHLSVFLIIPISIVAFFFGFEFFGLNQYGFSTDANFLDTSIFLSLYYVFASGLIAIFFPFGVIIALYKLTFSFNDFHSFFKKKKKEHQHLVTTNPKFRDFFYYLLLFLVPFLFFIFTTYYAIVIFLPIILIFSVQGLVYIKNFLSNFTIFSRKLDLVFPVIPVLLLISYYLLRIEDYLRIALVDILLLSFISLALFLLVFLIHKNDNLHLSFSSLDSKKLKNFFWMVLLTLSILTSSIINVESSRYDGLNSSYPWDNRYLTDEEIQIIDYFKGEDVNGLIFVADRLIAERIGAVGFLPTFSVPTLIGISLFYGIITPNYVYEHTNFSLRDFFSFTFFNFTQIDPIDELRSNIKNLDVRNRNDYDTLLSYNIQYIITINETYQSGGINNWHLIRSLKLSELYEPIFTTHHLLIWKIY